MTTPATTRDYHTSHPVSVRLPEDARQKLALVARIRGTSVHAEILSAVAAHLSACFEEAAA